MDGSSLELRSLRSLAFTRVGVSAGECVCKVSSMPRVRLRASAQHYPFRGGRAKGSEAVPERPEPEQPSTHEHCPSAPSERLSAVTADASTERRATADGGRKGDARKRARKGG